MDGLDVNISMAGMWCQANENQLLLFLKRAGLIWQDCANRQAKIIAESNLQKRYNLQGIYKA